MNIENILKDVVADLKKKYPKLQYDLVLADRGDGIFCYTLSIDYVINEYFEIESCFFIKSRDYSRFSANPGIEEGDTLFYLRDYGSRITSKSFEPLSNKGTNSLNMIKECHKYFKQYHKQKILNELNKETS